MIPGAGDAARQWSRMGNRKHSVFPEPVPVAMMVEWPGAVAGSGPVAGLVERPAAGDKPGPPALAAPMSGRPAPVAAPALVPVVVERPAVAEPVPALAARREKAMRWCRYGVNPSGISGKGSPPSGAGWKGRAMERYGPLARFPGSARKSSTTFASAGLDGPKPVARKSRSAPVTSEATTEGIMGAGVEYPPGGGRLGGGPRPGCGCSA